MKETVQEYTQRILSNDTDHDAATGHRESMFAGFLHNAHVIAAL
jgi:hypothetical protein